MDSQTRQVFEDRFAPPSFRLPVEAGKRGVIVFDHDHRVAYTDSNISHLLGVDPAALIGKSRESAVRDVLKYRFKSPEGYESSCDRLREYPEEVLDDVLELVGTENRVIHRYSAPLYDEDRQSSGRIEIYSDITKRRGLETAARHAYEELRATQEQLVQAEKLRAVGEIASGVAHDFNNTLGIILGNIQLLLRSETDEKSHARLEAAERAALDGVDTVRRIQEFTRSSPEIPPVVLDLATLVAEVVEMMRPAWEKPETDESATSVRLEAAEGLFVLGSGHELREVITNILLNAVQAMPGGGSIDVSTGCTHKSCWVRVADTGTGMSEEVRSRVFDPFFTTRGVQGTGLGMSVAYGIVKRHNGHITIESDEGKGTVVTVFLPMTTGTLAEVIQDTLEPVCVEPARILVVDDEEMFVSVFVEMLTECGHAAVVARSGSEAIAQFKEEQFDLVFSDLGMPEMSGWQVADAIKGINPATPVVLVTGWGSTIDESALTDSQVDMLIAKPIRLEKLSAVVEEALSRRK